MEKHNGHCTTAEGILKVMLYFDIFQYPLTKEEMIRFGSLSCSSEKLQVELDSLVNNCVLHRFDQFYSLHQKDELIERRKKGNREAEKKMRVARWVSRLIGWFPFVRAVMLSGSISKGYMDKHSDIDYFVITVPGKVWTTRLFLALFKRIFLLNSKRYFCVNYYLDSDHLEIEEKNIFTATELVTLIPMYGDDYYHQLMEQNEWVKEFIPNFSMDGMAKSPAHRKGLFKRAFEIILKTAPGHRLEQAAQKAAVSRWAKRYKASLPETDFTIAFKSKEYVSKSHPEFYQRKVLEKYSYKLMELEHRLVTVAP